MIKVVKVTIDGTWCILRQEELQSFLDSESPDSSVKIETFEMKEEVYNELPEFDGF